MSVAFDALGYAAGSGLTTKDTLTFTVGAGSNRALVVGIAFSNTGISGLTVVWEPSGTNQSLTQIGTDITATGVLVRLYGLIAPASATDLVRVTWTGTSDIVMSCASYTGVDQTGSTTSFAHFNSATAASGSPSIVITSATGNMTQDATGVNNQNLSAPTQTVIRIDNNDNLITGAGSYGTGAATVTHSWTCSSANWAQAGVDIVAVGGGGGPTVAQYQNAIDAQRNAPGVVGINHWWT